MSFALFLQPMSPDDFLVLVLSDPLETVRAAYGIQAAVLFWISIALTSIGLLGLTCIAARFKKPATSAKRQHKNTASTEYAEENWSFL